MSPTLPPAVAAWLDLVEERAGRLGRPRVDLVLPVVRYVRLSLLQLVLWMDEQPADLLAEALTQTATAARALAAHVKRGTPRPAAAPAKSGQNARGGPLARPAPAKTMIPLDERIRAAWKRAGGDANSYVRLALLRAQLPNEPRSAVDEALVRMQLRGEGVLFPIDAPQRLQPEDHAAAMRVAGARRDLVFLGPKLSDEAVLLAALERTASHHLPGTLLTVHDVRKAAPGLKKKEFDAAALSLSRARRVTLHHHDHAPLVSEEDRAGMVWDEERDVYYVGIVGR